jgi:hypothetical protein
MQTLFRIIGFMTIGLCPLSDESLLQIVHNRYCPATLSYPRQKDKLSVPTRPDAAIDLLGKAG